MWNIEIQKIKGMNWIFTNSIGLVKSANFKVTYISGIVYKLSDKTIFSKVFPIIELHRKKITAPQINKYYKNRGIRSLKSAGML